MKQFAGQPFTYVGINSDKDRHKAAKMAKEHQLSWTNVWCGPEGPAEPMPETWGVTGWPATFLLDRQGRIRHRGLRGEELTAKITEMLAEPQ